MHSFRDYVKPHSQDSFKHLSRSLALLSEKKKLRYSPVIKIITVNTSVHQVQKTNKPHLFKSFVTKGNSFSDL